MRRIRSWTGHSNDQEPCVKYLVIISKLDGFSVTDMIYSRLTAYNKASPNGAHAVYIRQSQSESRSLSNSGRESPMLVCIYGESNSYLQHQEFDFGKLICETHVAFRGSAHSIRRRYLTPDPVHLPSTTVVESGHPGETVDEKALFRCRRRLPPRHRIRVDPGFDNVLSCFGLQSRQSASTGVCFHWKKPHWRLYHRWKYKKERQGLDKQLFSKS